VEHYARVIIILLFLFFPSSLFGKTIGEVTYLKGNGILSRQKDEYDLVKNLDVESNDQIETGQGLTTITFEDKTQVRIKDNSKLIIDDFVYDSKPKSVNRLALKVAIGTVRYASGGIAKNNNKDVDIQTPVATIAVRGTEFSMVVNEIGESTVILLPNFDGTVGEIEVLTMVGSVVMNKPFMTTHVNSSSNMPTRPVVLDITEDMISNRLIVSTPPELMEVEEDVKTAADNILDVDFLEFNELSINQLDNDGLEFNKLDVNYLDLEIKSSLPKPKVVKNIIQKIQKEETRVVAVERVGYDEETKTYGIVDSSAGTQTIQRFVGGDISITYPLGISPTIKINQYGQEVILNLGNDNVFSIEQN
jgi:hypothetical protein